MSEAGEQNITADYLAPFETFQAFTLKNAMMYRGRVLPQYAADRALLAETLEKANGEYHIEELDGRTYATLRVYRGKKPADKLWLHALLLVITVITTLGAGAEIAYGWEIRPMIIFELLFRAIVRIFAGDFAYAWNPLLSRALSLLAMGLPYAVPLLVILLTHEFGHYIASKKYGVDVTLPFVIPAPGLFGTLGAIIKMRSPITHRRALFDIGAAGPLAGFVAALIIVIIGIALSSPILGYIPGQQNGITFGTSPLLAAISYLFHGTINMHLHPMAIAGWFGMLITFINLIPLGQFDGGHICYALFGRRQHIIGMISFILLVAAGIFWFRAWLTVAVLALLLIKIKHPPVVDESVSIGRGRMIVGIIIIILFFAIAVPTPISGI